MPIKSRGLLKKRNSITPIDLINYYMLADYIITNIT
jgi:hypothetical protein